MARQDKIGKHATPVKTENNITKLILSPLNCKVIGIYKVKELNKKWRTK